MTKSLFGKSALVTGGSRGIGAATVRRLAMDGAAAAFTYASSDQKAAALVAEIEADGGQALAIRADSADPEAVQHAVAETASRFGHLDILVNNAGILLRGRVDAFSLADFDRMLAVNVRAVFVAVQAAVAHMGAGGRIITIGSVTADPSAFPGASVYSMTKAAVAALTRAVAADFITKGIRCNCICPGTIETPSMLNRAAAAGPGGREMFVSRQPMGRLGTAAEIASLAVYLASDESAFTTGVAHIIDGGWTL